MLIELKILGKDVMWKAATWRALTFSFIFLLSYSSMAQAKGVLVIGQAIYDVYIKIDRQNEYSKLAETFNVQVGDVAQINREQADNLLVTKHSQFIKEFSGGSAANTAASLAFLSSDTTFYGIIAADDAGKRFKESMQMIGAKTKLVTVQNKNAGTGRVFSFINPRSGERTMLAYPGISKEFQHIDVRNLEDYNIFLTEAYALGDTQTKEKILNLMHECKKHGIKTALNLSSASIVRGNKEQIQEIVPHVDILIGNVTEYEAMFGGAPGNLVNNALSYVNIAVMTQGEQGAVIADKQGKVFIPAINDITVKDTTGAGDAFAAGFLHGYLNGDDFKTSGQIGARLAAQIIQQVGARPETKLTANTDDKLHNSMS